MAPRSSLMVMVFSPKVSHSSKWSNTIKAGSCGRRRASRSREICCSGLRKKKAGSLAPRALRMAAMASGRVVCGPSPSQTIWRGAGCPLRAIVCRRRYSNAASVDLPAPASPLSTSVLICGRLSKYSAVFTSSARCIISPSSVGGGVVVDTPKSAAPFLSSGPPASPPIAVGPSAVGPVAAGPSAVGPVAVGPVAAGPVAAGPVAVGPVAAGPVAAGHPQGVALLYTSRSLAPRALAVGGGIYSPACSFLFIIRYIPCLCIDVALCLPLYQKYILLSPQKP